MKIQRGSVVIINFEPSVGHEIKKVRPALVIQNNLACEHSPLITVVPLSSRPFSGKIYEVKVLKSKDNGLLSDSVLLTNQIMTFDKSRLLKVVGHISGEQLAELYKKIDKHFGR